MPVGESEITAGIPWQQQHKASQVAFNQLKSLFVAATSSLPCITSGLNFVFNHEGQCAVSLPLKLLFKESTSMLHEVPLYTFVPFVKVQSLKYLCDSCHHLCTIYQALRKVVQDGCQGAQSLLCRLPSTASPQATSLLFPLSPYCFFTVVQSVIFSSFTILMLILSLFLSLSLSQVVCFPFCLSFSKALSYFFLSSPFSRGLRYATPSVSNLQKRQGHLFPHGLALNHLSKTQPVYSLCDNRADDGGGVSL